MVVVKCNRCGKEIKDKYYTIAFAEESLTPKVQDTLLSVSASIVKEYYHTPESLLSMMNSKPMFCESCKDEIYEVINKKPDLA